MKTKDCTVATVLNMKDYGFHGYPWRNHWLRSSNSDLEGAYILWTYESAILQKRCGKKLR